MRSLIVWQRERDEFTGVAAAADRYDDVLLAVDHVRHRRTALWRRHPDRTDLAARRFVPRTQHRAAWMVRRGRDLRIAHHDDRLGVHQADARNARLTGFRNVDAAQ